MISPFALLVALLRLVIGVAGLLALLSAGLSSVGAAVSGNLVLAFSDGAFALVCGFFGIWAFAGDRFIRVFDLSPRLHNQRLKLPPPSAASK